MSDVSDLSERSDLSEGARGRCERRRDFRDLSDESEMSEVVFNQHRFVRYSRSVRPFTSFAKTLGIEPMRSLDKSSGSVRLNDFENQNHCLTDLTIFPDAIFAHCI